MLSYCWLAILLRYSSHDLNYVLLLLFIIIIIIHLEFKHCKKIHKTKNEQWTFHVMEKMYFILIWINLPTYLIYLIYYYDIIMIMIIMILWFYYFLIIIKKM